MRTPPVGPPVAALERRDVQRDRRQSSSSTAHGASARHRGDAFHVPLARVAHLDLARLLARLRRQIAELVVLVSSQTRQRNSGIAIPCRSGRSAIGACARARCTRPPPATPQSGSNPPPGGFRSLAKRRVPPEQGQGRHLSEQTRRACGSAPPSAPGRRCARHRGHGGFEQCQPVYAPRCSPGERA